MMTGKGQDRDSMPVLDEMFCLPHMAIVSDNLRYTLNSFWEGSQTIAVFTCLFPS